MYSKLAWGNVRRSAKDFSIYFLTLMISVAVFYAFSSIGVQTEFLTGESARAIAALSQVMPILTYLLMVITGFLMLYANNYLIRRRKKEFSLYQILGMRSSGVSRILILETLISTIVPAILGIILGIMISQLMIFISAAIFEQKVTSFHFVISIESIISTLIGLFIMFCVMAILNVHSIRKNNLIKMMQANRQNDAVAIRGVVPTLLASIVGFGLMALAYKRLSTDGLSFLVMGTNADHQAFAITTLIVFVGSIVFFYGVAGLLLYICQLIRPLYNKGLTAFTLRQLASKLSSRSLSMAVNAFFLFLACTIVSVGMSFGAQYNSIGYSAPYGASVFLAEDVESVEAPDLSTNVLSALIDTGHISSSAKDLKSATAFVFSSQDIPGGESILWSNLSKASGVALPDMIEESVENGYELTSSPTVMSESNFNSLRALIGLPSVNLSNSHYLIASQADFSAEFFTSILSKNLEITLNGTSLSPLSSEVISDPSANYTNNYMPQSYMIVVPDTVVEGLHPHTAYLNIMGDSAQIKEAFKESVDADNDVYLGGSSHTIEISDGSFYAPYNVVSQDNLKDYAVTNYGLMAYLSVYIGLTFVLSCAVVLAIQQLSATSDASKSYVILFKLGASKAQVARSIFFQVALYFALPMVIALSHTRLVLKLMDNLLKLLGSNTDYLVICIAVFVLVYVAYFILTYLSCRLMVMSNYMKDKTA